MKAVKKIGLFLMIWLLAGVGQTQVPVADNPEAWKGLTQDQVKKVKAGEIVILDKNLSSSDEAKRFIQTAMIFNQPIDAVWTLLSQTEKQEQYSFIMDIEHAGKSRY